MTYHRREHRPRVGIIGGGTIAAELIRDIQAKQYADIDYVLVSSKDRKRHFTLNDDVLIDDPGQVLSRDVDLVIEVALPEIFAQLAPSILLRSDFCGFSCTALARETTYAAIQQATGKSGKTCHVPHGAIFALDGLADGRDALESVSIVTTKNGKSFGADPSVSCTIFEGSARDACLRFPRNVNVHAALALAGIGFDRTQSRIVAVPGKDTMEHQISVRGRGLSWELHVSSTSLGGVTGAYTPLSATGSIRRVLSGSGIRIA